MAIITCPHCGAKVGDQERACTQCGSQLSVAAPAPGQAATGRHASSLLPVFFGALLIAGVLTALWWMHHHPTVAAAHIPASEEARDRRDAETKFNESVRRAILGSITIRGAQLHPDSYKLDRAILTEDGDICYTYHTRSDSGGTNAENAVLPIEGKPTIGESEAGREAWAKSCDGQPGTDITTNIGSR